MTTSRFPATTFGSFCGEVVRIVESQEQVATTRIVGNLAEQDLLEHMLEDSKPGSIDPGLHYLLSTPFRYPPLRHGSRFGSTLEPSLFYASMDLRTCLQECAYYRFIFWYDMASPPPNPVTTQHTVFRNSSPIVAWTCSPARMTGFGRRFNRRIVMRHPRPWAAISGRAAPICCCSNPLAARESTQPRTLPWSLPALRGARNCGTPN